MNAAILRSAAWLAASVVSAAAVVHPASARAADAAEPSQRPNVLWITCEDLSLVLGCYGDARAVTPNIDRLASQGVRYTRAMASASVCSPARSTLITGMYAPSLGTQHLRSVLPLPEGVRPFPEYLRAAGYYCTNNVKEDYQFVTPPTCWDESSAKAHWRGRKPGQPFFAVFNLMTTHQSRIRFSDEEFAELTARLKPEERCDPATVALPPYYPDTPAVRRDVARVYDLTAAMDREVADLLEQLDADGLAGETIVFFYADNGTGMPRHKRWLFDGGVRVPLVVRFPEKYRHLSPGEPGTTCDRLVSFVDFAPTVLSLCGLEVPQIMQGKPFLGSQAAPPAAHIFLHADRVDEVYDMSRAVSDGRWKFIRNYMPHRPRMPWSTFSEITPTRQEFHRLAAEGKLEGPAADMMRPTKPPLELYDTQNDPHELTNLAGRPEHAATLRRLHSALRAWMGEIGDTGLLPEPEMFRRAAGRSPYTMARTRGEVTYRERDEHGATHLMFAPGEFPVAEILAAAESVGSSADSMPRQVAGLEADDPAVRYWSAVGLLARGEEARPAVERLKKALDDSSAVVRLTAAEALVRLGGGNDALPVVVEALRSDDPYTQLYAAVTLSALGPRAAPVLPAMRAKLARLEGVEGDYPMFIRWGLERAVDLSVAP